MRAACRHVLTSEQVAAVTHSAQRLIILAGPGTGKTHVIANRIARKIHDDGMRPDELLALSFTERAVDTLKMRIAAIDDCESISRDCQVHTFHSFANDLLRTYHLEAGLPSSFRVCNPVEEFVFLQNNIRLLEAPAEYRHPRALPQLLNLFSSIQELGISQKRLLESTPTIGAMFQSFQRLKHSESILTFTDLIETISELLDRRPDIFKLVAEAYRHVFVDEFQDVNPALLNCLIKICHSSDTHTTIVGDDDQSIFGFRGAFGTSFRSFQTRFPEAVTTQLTCNFRCPEEVVAASHRLIQHNLHRFAAFSQRKPTSSVVDMAKKSVQLLSHISLEHSAKAIALYIHQFLKESGLSFDDVCILARTNTECARLAALLGDEGLPVYMFGAGLGHASALQTLISFLRAITHPYDSKSLFNAITSKPYGFTPLQLAELLQGFDIMSAELDESKPLWLRIVDAAKSCKDRSLQSECRKVVDDFAAFRASAVQDDIRKLAAKIATILDIGDEHMEAFYVRVHSIESVLQTAKPSFIVPYLTKLASHGDLYWDDSAPARPQTPHITVMTVHKAKGTEFAVVVLSITQDRSRRRPRHVLSLPSSLFAADAEFDLVEEERRLVYVAMTRARNRFVFASLAKSPSKISRFVSEAMGREILQSEEHPASG